MKNDSQVVQEFNELVNMTASELEKWLKSGDSNSAGWPKEDTSGESVGHDSGRKIVEILRANPKKDPKKYNEDHIEHMRKVVSYCKRHLAQEEKTNKEKSAEEVKKTKSYASLKNWGHDFLKGKEDNKAEGEDAKDEDEDEEAKNEGDDEKGEEASEDEGDKHAGDKRKQPAKAQKGSQKKRETRQGEAVGHGKKSDKDNGADEDEDGEDVGDDDVQQQSNGKGAKKRAEDEREDEEEGDGGKNNQDDGGKNNQDDGGKNNQDDGGKNNQDDGGKKANGSGKSAKNGPDPGDTVSWKWGGGHPEGKVLDVKEEKATVKTKRGNEVSRKGSKEDPAVVLDAGKSKAVKAAHELD